MSTQEAHDLEEELRKRMKRGSMHPFWYPETEGEEVSGRIHSIVASPWDRDGVLYTVELAVGGICTLPVNTTLYRVLEEEKVKVGDYIMARYVGTQTSRKGREVKIYEVGVVPGGEAPKFGGLAPPTPVPQTPSVPQPPAPQPPTPQPTPPAPAPSAQAPSGPSPPTLRQVGQKRGQAAAASTEPPASSEAPIPTAASTPPTTPPASTGIGTVHSFVKELATYFDKMTVSDLDYYLNSVKKFGVSTPVIIKTLGLRVEGEEVFLH